MGWTKADWFQLWTALAVTGGTAATILVYRLGLIQARMSAPMVRANARGKQDFAEVQFSVIAPDTERWSVYKVTVKAPKSARIGEPHFESDGGGGHRLIGVPGDAREKTFWPPTHSTTFGVISPDSPVVEFEFHMSLNANPKVTKRCASHIKIPA